MKFLAKLAKYLGTPNRTCYLITWQSILQLNSLHTNRELDLIANFTHRYLCFWSQTWLTQFNRWNTQYKRRFASLCCKVLKHNLKIKDNAVKPTQRRIDSAWEWQARSFWPLWKLFGCLSVAEQPAAKNHFAEQQSTATSLPFMFQNERFSVGTHLTNLLRHIFLH